MEEIKKMIKIVGNKPRHDQSNCRNSIKFHKADVDARCFGADIRSRSTRNEENN
jgi:hypothetical protein